MPPDEQTLEDLKRQQQSLKTTAVNMRREAVDASLPPDLRWSTMQARDKDASSWLNTVPLEEQELTLNKQQSLGLATFALQSARSRLAEPLHVWRSIHRQPRPVV